MIRSGFKLLLAPLMVALVLGGCGGKPAAPASSKAPGTENKTQAPAPHPKETTTAKIGGTDRLSLKHLPLFLNSFGKQQGVKVDFTEYSSGTKATEGLLGKEVDFGFLQVEHVLRDTSGDLRMIALITRYPGSALLVNAKYKDQIKSPKDLAGQKVGVSSMGAASHQFLLTVLANNKIDAKSVNILPVGLNAPEVFSQDKVVATVTIEPFITQAVASGQATIMLDARKADGTKQVYGAEQWPWIALVTRTDVIKNNPQLVERVAKAVAESLHNVATMSPDELVAQTPADFFPNGDSALFKKILEANQAQFSADGRLTTQLVQPVWTNMQNAGAIPKDKTLNLDAVSDLKFLSGN